MLYCELDIYDYEATIIDEMMEGVEIDYDLDEDEDEDGYEPDDEIGYNPYMGCYDWDC